MEAGRFRHRPGPQNNIVNVYLCFIIILLLCWSSANSQTQICGADGFNIQNLTKAQYWTYNTNEYDECPEENAISCQYSFSVCNTLPSSFNCDSCSVAVAVSRNITDINNYKSLGSYDSTKNPIDSTPTNSMFQIYYTQYPNGTILIFKCDLNSKWLLPISSNIGTVPESANTKIENKKGLNVFTFYSAEACYVPPSVVPYVPASEGLSTGSILLLIFFPTLIIYFLLGIILNKLGGANGKELIPNYEFWNSLPGLIADGVMYSWSILTCQGTKGATGYDSI
ncbi:uncharacterized protein [Antedon mediterranea]|uniref:uncharacterized protein n=1 Tax=Antedon mediterranea TaxID=105859 RepID=UPI003AF5F1A4